MTTMLTLGDALERRAIDPRFADRTYLVFDETT